MAARTEIIRVRPADEQHQVVTLTGVTGEAGQCRSPCPRCPWRKDAVGQFPAEAFRHSAETARDMSTHTFACHAAGAEHPLLCAGFLLSESADHNLAVRLRRIRQGKLEEVSSGGLDLFPTYRAMAEANGVAPDDPALQGTR